jgi:hypothetical protein
LQPYNLALKVNLCHAPTPPSTAWLVKFFRRKNPFVPITMGFTNGYVILARFGAGVPQSTGELKVASRLARLYLPIWLHLFIRYSSVTKVDFG